MLNTNASSLKVSSGAPSTNGTTERHEEIEAAFRAVDPKQRCIFITGMPRSGTTLFSALLDSHSQISISPETHFFTKYRRKGVRRNSLSSAAAFSNFVRYVLASEHVSSFGFSPDDREKIFHAIIESGERTYRVVLGTILAIYAAQQGKDIYGEKTPHHMGHIPDILETFPGARVLHVVRDPRDVVLSLKKVTWERGNMLEHLKQWRLSTRNAVKYSQMFPTRFYSVRYETMLSAPEATTRSICSFLEVPYEHDMIYYHERMNPNFDVDSEPWKAKNLEPLDSNNRMKWKSEMPYSELAIVEKLVGPEMIRLEYPLTHASMNVRGATHAAWLLVENATLLTNHWIRRAWLRLNSPY